MGFVLSTLPAAGQTGLNHHRQTTSCENIYIIPLRTEKYRKSFMPYCLNLYD